MKDRTSRGPGRDSGPGSRMRRSGLLAAVAAAAMAVAACSAVPGSPSGSVKYQQALAFAKCMRAHGLPGFPDPDGNGQFSGNGIDTNSPQVRSAARACQSLLPGQNPAAQQTRAQAQALRFSRCMRAHGVLNFPDPSVKSNGSGTSVTIRMQAGSGGIDPNAPQFKAAMQACRSILPQPGSHSSGSSQNGSEG